MRLPVSFDDVWYFRKEYRGDLIVTDGVLYYFPHTNAELEKARRNAPGAADGVAPFIGAAGEALNLGLGLYKVAAGLWRKLRRPTINRPRLKQAGLWAFGANSRDMQALLDARVEAARREPARLVAYELTLPKPMRFAAAEMRGVRLRLGVLKFDTEFDGHDFTVGLRRAKLLRRALRDGGFAG
ncbi:MAG TPA: hypothetical protein VF621_05995 [Pyrinomonadaceae bacterium]